jgi:hypothetical protein
MSTTISVPLIAAVLIAVSVVAQAETSPANERRWKAGSWAEAVQRLPCTAFRRADDGAWVMPGKIELPRNNVITNMTVTDPADTEVLNKRCAASTQQ